MLLERGSGGAEARDEGSAETKDDGWYAHGISAPDVVWDSRDEAMADLDVILGDDGCSVTCWPDNAFEMAELWAGTAEIYEWRLDIHGRLVLGSERPLGVSIDAPCPPERASEFLQACERLSSKGLAWPVPHDACGLSWFLEASERVLKMEARRRRADQENRKRSESK